MNSSSSNLAFAFFGRRQSHFAVGWIVVVMIALAANCPLLNAQSPEPSASPAASPSPTPGVALNPALYLPQGATVQVADSSATRATSAVKRNNSRKASSDRGGAKFANASDETPPPAEPLQLTSPAMFSPTVLAAQPQAATITLNYNVACAGSAVMVAALDGGTLNGTLGGKSITVGADGTLVFTFQTPSGPGRYHVITRLGNSEISFPFDVPATADVSTPPPLPAAP